MRILVVSALLGSACSGPFGEPQMLGGISVSAEDLNAGHEKYILYCYACHGENGDGQGPASAYLRPPPRNFKDGIFKFAGVPAGELPHDDHLVNLVRRGLTGTAMLPWDVPEVELKKIIHYIKTFSPRWQNEKPGTPVEASADPFQGQTQAAVEHGKKIYHATAQCARCHPSYISKPELASLTKEV